MPRSNVVITHYQQMKPHQIYHSPINQHSSTASLSHSTASDLQSSPENFIQQHSFFPETQDHLHPFVKNEQAALPTQIPSSVKGAPPHLRPAIRKRQNSESAKRSRQRRKESAKIFFRRFDDQCQRLAALEQKVAKLIQLVKECDEEPPSETRPKQEEEVLVEDGITQPPDRAPSVVQTMAIAGGYEQQGDSASPFQDDLEALLETCIQSQHMFGSC